MSETKTTKIQGDYRLWRGHDNKVPDRRAFANQHGMVRDIFPGDVVNTDRPDDEWTYFWWREAPDDEFYSFQYDTLMDKGYVRVIPEPYGPWKVTRWRQDKDGVRSAGMLLFARPAELFRAEEAEINEEARLKTELQNQANIVHSLAQQAQREGVAFSSYQTIAGKTEEVVRSS